MKLTKQFTNKMPYVQKPKLEANISTLYNGDSGLERTSEKQSIT
jgi:hypothetical protein